MTVLLENYAALLRQTQRDTRALTMQAQAQAIRARYAQQNPSLDRAFPVPDNAR